MWGIEEVFGRMKSSPRDEIADIFVLESLHFYSLVDVSVPFITIAESHHMRHWTMKLSNDSRNPARTSMHILHSNILSFGEFTLATVLV